MANKMQIKRGNKANLPTLSDGELGFCKDTGELFIGNGGLNHPIAVTGGTSYLKFDDGTMIEWGSRKYTGINVGMAWGYLYASGDLPLDDYPEPFYSTPLVTVNTNQSGGGVFFPIKKSPATKTNPGTYMLCSAVGSAGGDCTLDYIAVGRWRA